ncbi:ribbon-helix-helix domain-containing protein [Cardiobacteriaceae bacterium TAE3-ERU3]|nr:ribbon-helix-helix domain-containing protein [Cardiobacteriaceae bacterium TAE3-ERU3]
MRHLNDRILVTMPSEVKNWLVEYSEKHDRPLTYVVRKAIEAFINQEEASDKNPITQ